VFSLAGFVFGHKQPGLNTRDRIMPGAWSKLEEISAGTCRVHRRQPSLGTSQIRALPAKSCTSQRVECILAKGRDCTNRAESRSSTDEFVFLRRIGKK